MKQYECDLCGYVYDEAAGDPDNGIAPGTKWEDLPADWVCPLCGAGKDEFTAKWKRSPASNGRGTSFLRRVASDAGRGYPALQCGDSGQDPQQQGAQNEASGGLADPHGQGVEGERRPEGGTLLGGKPGDLRTYQHHIADHRRQGRQRL